MAGAPLFHPFHIRMCVAGSFFCLYNLLPGTIEMKNNTERHERAAAEAEHTERIRGLFASIAGGYDFLNRFNSLRRDVSWRRKAASLMRFDNTRRFLDVATGTADIIIETLRAHPGVSAVGVDLVPELMDIGRQKLQRLGLSDSVELMEANALELPFEDASFDVSAMAFGIRNIRQRVLALSEMCRVVVPGGQVVVLELVFDSPILVRWLHRLYLGTIMPAVARVFSGNPDAYVYLARSIMEFHSPEQFKGQMLEAGLQDVQYHRLTLGVAGIFRGVRPG